MTTLDPLTLAALDDDRPITFSLPYDTPAPAAIPALRGASWTSDDATRMTSCQTTRAAVCWAALAASIMEKISNDTDENQAGKLVQSTRPTQPSQPTQISLIDTGPGPGPGRLNLNLNLDTSTDANGRRRARRGATRRPGRVLPAGP